MELKVLKLEKIRGDKHWLIGSGNLSDYLKEVDADKENKFSFEVQRKIVKNIYLDKILDTIELNEPIPFITLTAKIKDMSKRDSLNLKDFDILDGLQRTYRLWAYWKIYERIRKTKNNNNDIKALTKELRSNFPEFFEKGIINSKILKILFNNKEILKKVFDGYEIYFVIWTNLSEEEIIRKMLILNAGQRPVSSKHQFELIFLHLLREIDTILNEKGIKIYREKDSEFNKLKKVRNVGEFAFSTLITSLLSLATGKPQRVSTELIYKYDLTEEEKSLSYAQDIFSKEFVVSILEKLLKMDNKYKDDPNTLVWLGKDTTLTGLFAAVGRYIKLDTKNVYYSAFPRDGVTRSLDLLIKRLPNNLNLNEFNKYYDSLAGRTLNIGTYIRKVVQYYIYRILENKKVSWREAFEYVEKE